MTGAWQTADAEMPATCAAVQRDGVPKSRLRLGSEISISPKSGLSWDHHLSTACKSKVELSQSIATRVTSRNG
ncbi:MAG: hypothetical protein ACXWJC_02455 [Croceibacterium sp.]